MSSNQSDYDPERTKELINDIRLGEYPPIAFRNWFPELDKSTFHLWRYVSRKGHKSESKTHPAWLDRFDKRVSEAIAECGRLRFVRISRAAQGNREQNLKSDWRADAYILDKLDKYYQVEFDSDKTNGENHQQPLSPQELEERVKRVMAEPEFIVDGLDATDADLGGRNGDDGGVNGSGK